MPRYIGKPIPRLEDARLITGRGRYTDDIPPTDAAWAHMLRSPHAHARISAIHIDAARGRPGVLAVLTAADYQADGHKESPTFPTRPTRSSRRSPPSALTSSSTSTRNRCWPPIACASSASRWQLIVARDARAGARRRRSDRGRLRAPSRRGLDCGRTCAFGAAIVARRAGQHQPARAFRRRRAVERAFRRGRAGHRARVREPAHRQLQMEPRAASGIYDAAERSPHADRRQPGRGAPSRQLERGARRATRQAARDHRPTSAAASVPQPALSGIRAGGLGGKAPAPAGALEQRPQRGLPVGLPGPRHQRAHRRRVRPSRQAPGARAIGSTAIWAPIRPPSCRSTTIAGSRPPSTTCARSMCMCAACSPTRRPPARFAAPAGRKRCS